MTNEESFVAYSGTTLRNYQSDAQTDEDGLVTVDKASNSQHRFPDIFFLEDPSGALEYAASLALETSDTPVVMEGRLPAQYRRGRTLPAGVPFPVRAVWIPSEEANRAELLAQAIFLGEAKEAFLDSMISVSPSRLLRRPS